MSAKFDSLKAREEAALCRTYGHYPLAVSRAEGSRLYDLDGREYVDLLSGIAVTGLGHSHPELVQVMREQAEKLIHVSNLFYIEERVVLAERLKETCHAGKVFLCNSGAESNEAAIKLARRYTRKVKGRDAGTIITLEGSFHGRTLATVAATGQARFKDGFEPIPAGFLTVPWGDMSALEAAIDADTAAVMVEIVQGEGGIRPMGQDYARAVEALCRDKGVLLIVDEVQSGLCRTGRFWAHQNYGLTPDIFTSAKALANGLPMGAMLCTEEVAAGFVPGVHATTFGGGGVVSAVAAKTVEILRRDRLDERAAHLGETAKAMFREIAAKRPGTIADVRGLGLMLGVELTFPGQEVWKKLLDQGFVLNLTQERVLRLLPALTIDQADLAAFAAALDSILAER